MNTDDTATETTDTEPVWREGYGWVTRSPELTAALEAESITPEAEVA